MGAWTGMSDIDSRRRQGHLCLAQYPVTLQLHNRLILNVVQGFECESDH
jgi:hypothetical protein